MIISDPLLVGQLPVAHARWRRDALRAHYGERAVGVGTIPYPKQFWLSSNNGLEKQEQQKDRLLISEYLDSDMAGQGLA